MSEEKKLSKDALSSIIKFAFAVSGCVDFCINEKEIPAAIKNIKEANELLNQAEKQVLQLIESAPKEPSEAKLEEFVDKLARDVRGWFIWWREQYPEENKDIDELPHRNAKNIVSVLLKKYRELLRRG